MTPTVSGNAHNASWDADGGDGSVTANCVTCHTTTPSTSHANGTLDGAPAVAFAASVFYTAGSPPNCGPNGGAYTTCHGPDSGNGDAGTWKRRWSATAASNDGVTECANCHGVPTANWDAPGDWTWNEGDATTTDHTNPYGGNTGNRMDEHSVCQSCHGVWRGRRLHHGLGRRRPRSRRRLDHDERTGALDGRPVR